MERLTGEVSLAEQISVMVDTICPQVAITMMMIAMMTVMITMPKGVNLCKTYKQRMSFALSTSSRLKTLTTVSPG